MSVESSQISVDRQMFLSKESCQLFSVKDANFGPNKNFGEGLRGAALSFAKPKGWEMKMLNVMLKVPQKLTFDVGLFFCFGGQ